MDSSYLVCFAFCFVFFGVSKVEDGDSKILHFSLGPGVQKWLNGGKFKTLLVHTFIHSADM